MNYLLMGLLLVSVAANFFVITGHQRVRALLRTGLRKAELDNCETVRLPYNQVAHLMGWTPEFDGDVRTSVYPFRESRDFAKSNERHPAVLSPHRRGKL